MQTCSQAWKQTGWQEFVQTDWQAGRKESHRRPWGPEIHNLGRPKNIQDYGPGGTMWVSQTGWQADKQAAGMQTGSLASMETGMLADILTDRQAGWQANCGAGRQARKNQQARRPY